MDDNGNAYVAGWTNSDETTFPLKNALQPVFGGGDFDVFVAKIEADATGLSSLLYSTFLGGSDADVAGGDVSGIDVDSFGNVYITGYTTSNDFPMENSLKPCNPNPGFDIFVTKIDTNAAPLDQLVCSTCLGGGDTGATLPSALQPDEVAYSIAVDANGNAYVTGKTNSVDFPTENPFQPTFDDVLDAFVVKIFDPPPVVLADIDIKPGSDPNSINCNNDQEVISVAILTTEDFDATTVDHTTVTFEGASETHVNRRSGEPRRHEEDVDGDGDTDLVFHFRLGATGLTCASTEGIFSGDIFGTPIEGTDSISMVPGTTVITIP